MPKRMDFRRIILGEDFPKNSAKIKALKTKGSWLYTHKKKKSQSIS
jgi:hypothetical protein